MVAGAPFFFGEGKGVPVGFGVALASGVALGDGDSIGEGLGVGDAFRFFFLPAVGEDSGDGLGEVFFFLGEADALGDAGSDAPGLAVVFFFGDGDFSGGAVGFGVGDFCAVDFFLVRFRGAGVGVGAKILLSFVPNDSSAGAGTANPPNIKQKIRAILACRIGAGR